jgi:biopolymer transport protein ExbB/TolQ
MWNLLTNDPLIGVNTFSFAWSRSPMEGRVIVGILLVFSLVSWTIMAAKMLQVRRSSRLNRLFWDSFRKQSHALNVYDQDLDVDGCPNFNVYMAGSEELCRMLGRERDGHPTRPYTPVVQDCLDKCLESAVANEATRIDSGMVILALAVSGAPFIGLLGTVWGVMAIFSDVAQAGTQAQLTTMAPGLSAAMMTTVAGLLVAIPSMFGYNWLISRTRNLSVELDNFAQAFSSAVLLEFSPLSRSGTRQGDQDGPQKELPLENDAS